MQFLFLIFTSDRILQKFSIAIQVLIYLTAVSHRFPPLPCLKVSRQLSVFYFRGSFIYFKLNNCYYSYVTNRFSNRVSLSNWLLPRNTYLTETSGWRRWWRSWQKGRWSASATISSLETSESSVFRYITIVIILLIESCYPQRNSLEQSTRFLVKLKKSKYYRLVKSYP